MKKVPISVLVVIHDTELNVLLLERADRQDFWQSVTGSLDFAGESLLKAAIRELFEETGLVMQNYQYLDWSLSRRFKIFDHWKHRYESGVKFNEEFVFSVCLPSKQQITISEREHISYSWFSLVEGAEKCFSWTNRLAIKELPERFKLGKYL